MICLGVPRCRDAWNELVRLIKRGEPHESSPASEWLAARSLSAFAAKYGGERLSRFW